MSDPVNHPAHYGGEDSTYEMLKVAEAWGLDADAYLFNVVKYVSRWDRKGDPVENLKKARFYLDRKIARMEAEGPEPSSGPWIVAWTNRAMGPPGTPLAELQAASLDAQTRYEYRWDICEPPEEVFGD